MCREEEKKNKEYQVVDVHESMWSLDEEDDASGQPCKVLMVSLVRPPPTEDEIMFRKGAPIRVTHALLDDDNVPSGNMHGVVCPARQAHGQHVGGGEGSQERWQEGRALLRR